MRSPSDTHGSVHSTVQVVTNLDFAWRELFEHWVQRDPVNRPVCTLVGNNNVDALDVNPGTRAPGHRNPSTWSQGIFLFYFLFILAGVHFFSKQIFSLFFLSLSLSLSLFLCTHILESTMSVVLDLVIKTILYIQCCQSRLCQYVYKERL